MNLPALRSPARRLFGAALFLAGLGFAASSAPAGCAQKPPCARNSDCVGAYCAEGVCKQDCVDSEVDCPKGYVCNIVAKCEPADGSTTTTGAGGGPATTTGAGGATTTTGATTSAGGGPASSGATTASTGVGPGGSTTASTGSGGGVKTILDPCASDGECAANLACRALVRNGEKRCVPTCVGNGPCPAGTRCETVDGTQYCAGDDAGRACNGAAACNFACVNGPKYCTVPCAGGADCPNGYGCMAVGGQTVCVKAEAPCSAQDASACVVPAACDTSLSLIVGGCTLACSSAADCPRRAAGLPPWSCDGLCRRPIDVVGPLEGGFAPAQYACDAQSQPVNLCNDNKHLDFGAFVVPAPPAVNCASPTTTDGVPGDACVDSCRYQGGCRFGFACVALGGIGNARIGLCLPAGQGEVGSACSTDGQCAFGYCAGGKCSRDCTYDDLCPTGSSCLAVGGPAVEGLAFKRCQ